MPKKYLELESTYRNRNLFPNQACFDVQISQSGVHAQGNAVDPITYAYPVKTFRISDESITGSVGVFTPSAALNVSSPTKFIFNIPTASITNPKSNIFNKNYYVGAVIYQTTIATSPETSSVGRILEWTYLAQTATSYTFSVLIDTPPISTSSFYNNTSFSIGQMSFIGVTGPQQIFIPSAGNCPNLYNNYYVFNQTRTAYTKISNFDMDTHLAVAQSDISSWTGSDILVLRKSLPNIYNGTYELINPSSSPSQPVIQNYNICTLKILGSAPAAYITSNGSYINSFVRYYPETSPLTSECLVTRIVGVVVEISGGGMANHYSVDTTGSLYTQYAGKNPPFTITPTQWIATADLIPPSRILEIMPYSTDNFSPFVYNGSLSSQNQTVAYEVCLNSLILPNVVLSTGGRISYYPFVYVEIENIGSSSSNINTIYSNNPNTYKAIFKVPITDLNHPKSAPFVKLTGNGMKQTIPFKINSDMRVNVKLPDGSLFTTHQSDNTNGQRPNPMLQISFTFEVSRV
jgi:hypothetical protein